MILGQTLGFMKIFYVGRVEEHPELFPHISDKVVEECLILVQGCFFFTN